MIFQTVGCPLCNVPWNAECQSSTVWLMCGTPFSRRSKGVSHFNGEYQGLTVAIVKHPAHVVVFIIVVKDDMKLRIVLRRLLKCFKALRDLFRLEEAGACHHFDVHAEVLVLQVRHPMSLLADVVPRGLAKVKEAAGNSYVGEMALNGILCC